MLDGRVAAGLAALLLALALFGGRANAEGVTRIQQSDGSIRVYSGVTIRLSGETLWLRSGDGRGVLEVASEACSFAGEVQRCLPYAATLHQRGEKHAIVLERGTVYLNLTADPQHLPHSAEPLAPHAVLVLLHTIRGTFVSVRGTLDDVK